MAGELSDTYENLSLDHLLNKAQMLFPNVNGLYFGINRDGDPGENLGPGYNEPTGEGNYGRAQIAGSEWNSASGRAITNNGDSNTWASGGFNGGQPLTQEITNATHWTLWTSSGGTTTADYVGRAQFPLPQTFAAGIVPIIEDGTFSIGWTARGATDKLSTYAAHRLCEHIVGKTPWDTSGESRYAYLSDADPVVSAPNEPTAGSYERPLVPPATWGNTAAGANNNANNPIQFPKASADWLAGALLGWGGLYDQLTGGNELIHGELAVAMQVLENQRPNFAVTKWAFTID